MDSVQNIIEAVVNAPVFGALVNAVTIIFGALLGLLFKKGIPERISDTLSKGLALCVLMIGAQGIMKGSNTLVTILSVVLGGLLGELIGIDNGMQKLGLWVQSKVSRGENTSPIAEGFVSASLLFVVGAMAVVGSLQSGLARDHSTVFAKSILDGVSSVIFASTLGFGVLLSAIPVLVYQGGITLLAGFLSPLLSDIVIAEMTAAGSVLIIGLSLNMLGLTKTKVANYLPAIFLPILLCTFM